MKICTVIVFLLLISMVCLADIPPPKSEKNREASTSIDTYLSIDLDREAKEARLIIPRSQLKTLRAELDALEAGGDDATSAAGVTRLQTIVGGALLSLAFVFGGFWIIKPGRLSGTGGKTAAAGAVILAGGALAAITFGNAGPPAAARSITGKMFTEAVHMYGFGSGRIKLEVSDELRNPKLIVPNPRETKKADE